MDEGQEIEEMARNRDGNGTRRDRIKGRNEERAANEDVEDKEGEGEDR